MRTFLATLLILFVPIIAILGIIFYAVNGTITITDSGSTNAPAFTLSINPNGSGTWTDASGDLNPFDSFTVDYDGLVKAIRTPEVLKELFVTKPACAHSVSFGSTETLNYNYITSGDITCVSDPAFQSALSSVLTAAKSQHL